MLCFKACGKNVFEAILCEFCGEYWVEVATCCNACFDLMIIIVFIHFIDFSNTAGMEDKANGSVDTKRYSLQLV